MKTKSTLPIPLPYTPHVLSRWSWILWLVIAMMFAPTIVRWVYRFIMGTAVPDRLEGSAEIFWMVGIYGLVIWSCWCQPLIFAYDPWSNKKMRHRAPKSLLWITQLGPLIGLVTVVMVMVFLTTAVVVEWDTPEALMFLAWLFFVVLLLPFALYATRRVRQNCRRKFRRRVALLNLCFDCGYDLRATEAACCPECGVAIDLWSDAERAAGGERPAADRPIG
ncbi:MAG: hypothetical protein AAF086_03910 [Planctomycetota bacterium]